MFPSTFSSTREARSPHAALPSPAAPEAPAPAWLSRWERLGGLGKRQKPSPSLPAERLLLSRRVLCRLALSPGAAQAGPRTAPRPRRRHPARPGLRHPPPPRRTSTRSVKPTVRALNLWARSSLTWRRAGWLCGTTAAPVAAAQPAWDAGSRKTRSAAGVLLSSSAALLRIAPQR